MNCYEVIAGRAVSVETKALLKSVQSGLDTLVSNNGLFSYNNTIDVAQFVDVLRYFVEMRLEHSSNKALANIFLTHLNSTEIKSAGSGIIFVAAFCRYLTKGLQIQQLKEFRETLQTHTFTGQRGNLRDLRKVMTSFCDSHTVDLILKATQAVGAEGSLKVSTHTSIAPTTLEVDDMYRFDGKVNDVFVQQTGRSQFTLTSPAIVTIDGMIESTAEIDLLMRQSFETGQPVVIAARGYHQDVANTLAHNYVHGALRVIPFEVRYDEIGANSLIDMSKVVQSKFINSLRGDLISTTSLEEDAGSAKKIEIQGDTIGIETQYKTNSLTQRTIDRQRIKLIKKLEGCGSTVQNILDARIKSLTPSFCSISIKTKKGLKGIEKDRANCAIRLMKDVSEFGFVDLTSIDVHDSYFMRELLDQLIESGITHVPVKSLNVGIRSAAACAETFLRLGACLVIDEQPDSCL